ncbi:hypothetical protein KP509_37G025700 [Ceratopteris richardii]|uniref:Uncharacterized protein n=1 Tax=Ceratopteris richardii TaxID=49495 RepID=A0A8T2Q7R0_CERRI|nr:hypothetical protein KP509_37G025700 [Ceratopteris richardii]
MLLAGGSKSSSTVALYMKQLGIADHVACSSILNLPRLQFLLSSSCSSVYIDEQINLSMMRSHLQVWDALKRFFRDLHNRLICFDFPINVAPHMQHTYLMKKESLSLSLSLSVTYPYP